MRSAAKISAMSDRPLGLPERLPEGEVIIWQGRPDWWSLAMRAFHIKAVGIYFGLILIWRAALGLSEHLSLLRVAEDALPLLLMALITLGISALLAWIYRRTTTYTITNRRVFLRFGAALPMMVNIPFGIVVSASAKVHRDGTADIPLQLAAGAGRVAYLHLWPHARAWYLNNPQPMLRSLPDGAHVAAMLASALAASAPGATPQAARALVPNAPTADANGPFAPAAA